MSTFTIYLSFVFGCLLAFHANLSHGLHLPVDVLKAKDLPILGSLTSLGSGGPPNFIMTNNPSEECIPINKGAHLCCDATFNGGNGAVQLLAGLANYKLNPNAVNGIECSRSTDGTCPTGKASLCCQVADLLGSNPTLAAMWCACADSSLNPPKPILGVCQAS